MRILAVIVIGLAAIWPEAWALMILIGVVHGEWLHAMPTLDYLSAVRIVGAISLVSIVLAFTYGMVRAVMEEA